MPYKKIQERNGWCHQIKHQRQSKYFNYIVLRNMKKINMVMEPMVFHIVAIGTPSKSRTIWTEKPLKGAAPVWWGEAWLWQAVQSLLADSWMRQNWTCDEPFVLENACAWVWPDCFELLWIEKLVDVLCCMRGPSKMMDGRGWIIKVGKWGNLDIYLERSWIKFWLIINSLAKECKERKLNTHTYIFNK